MSSKGGIIAVVVVVLLIGFAVTQVAPFKQDFANFIASDKASTAGTAITSDNSSQNANASSPVWPNVILSALEGDNAAAPNPFLGKSVYVYAIIDSVKGDALTGFYSDESDLYLINLDTTEGAIFNWANQSVASQVPFGPTLVTDCTVGGTKSILDSAVTVVVLNDCVVITNLNSTVIASQTVSESAIASSNLSTVSSSATSTTPVESSQLVLGGILHAQYFGSSFTGDQFACGANGASLGQDWGALTITNNGQGGGSVTSLTIVYNGQSNSFNLVGSCSITSGATTSVDLSTQSHLGTTPVVGQPAEVLVGLSTGSQLALNTTFY